jgi:hypothetical protein
VVRVPRRFALPRGRDTGPHHLRTGLAHGFQAAALVRAAVWVSRGRHRERSYWSPTSRSCIDGRPLWCCGPTLWGWSPNLCRDLAAAGGLPRCLGASGSRPWSRSRHRARRAGRRRSRSSAYRDHGAGPRTTLRSDLCQGTRLHLEQHQGRTAAGVVARIMQRSSPRPPPSGTTTGADGRPCAH